LTSKRKKGPYKTRAEKILSLLSRNRNRWLTCRQIGSMLVSRKAVPRPTTQREVKLLMGSVGTTLRYMRERGQIDHRLIRETRYEYRAFRVDSNHENICCHICRSTDDLDRYRGKWHCRNCLIGEEDNSATVQALISTGGSNLGLID